MEIEHWAAQATHYALAAARLRAVGRATGRADVMKRADALSAMANGYVTIGFEMVAAAHREGGKGGAAAVRQGGGWTPGETG